MQLGSFRYVEVVQNNGKEMYKKRDFFALSPIDFLAFLALPSLVSITPVLIIFFSGVQF